MKIAWLQGFCAVAKYNSFSAAAEELFISQSNISKHIRFLEEELNVTLFERSTRSISITAAGRALLPRAQAILRDYERLCAEAAPFQGEGLLRLAIATVPIMHLYNLPLILRDFRAQYPNVLLEITESDMLGVVEYLKQSSAVIGIVRDCAIDLLPDGVQWKIYPFLEDELVLLCHVDHPLAAQENITIEDCLNSSLITLNAGFNEYQLVLKNLGIPPQRFQPMIRCSSTVTLQNYVRSNLGVSMLTQGMAARLCEEGTMLIRRFAENPRFPLVIAVRESILSPMVQALIQRIITSFRHMEYS